jgi:hypothetical protein
MENNTFRYLPQAAALLALLALNAAVLNAKTLEVRCEVPGHSIGKALEIAQPGDIIAIQGICSEHVTITTDHVTLDGGNAAVIRGSGMAFELFHPLVGIHGAQGVVLRGVRIEDGPAEAVAVQNGAAAALVNVALRGSTIGLMVAANSTVELMDSSVEDNFVGVDMFTSSSLVLKGSVAANSNLRNGIDVTGSSTVEIRGAQVEANQNGGQGITLTGSEMLLLGFPPAQGSSITANGNGSNGIVIAAQASLNLFGAPGANSVTTMNNAIHGIWVPGGSIFSPQATARFLIVDNPVGVAFESGGGATITGGLEVRNNGTGVLADGAGVLTLSSAPMLPSSIAGNTSLDVDARFGSRIRLAGVIVGPNVACDATLISEGMACP